MSRRLILRWTWLARYGIQGDPDPHCERLRPGLVGQLPKPSTDAFRKSIKLFRDRYNSKIAKFRESNPATPLRDVQDEGWLYVRPFSRDKGVGSVKTLNENLHTRGAVVEDDSDDDEARYWRVRPCVFACGSTTHLRLAVRSTLENSGHSTNTTHDKFHYNIRNTT
ncbi:hypothetical protein CB0940_09088 [Cercospora beticola]|uniref:Uncharacterized protein n=1 Tax=Cercospora beticola TaxID=122368 RepID=A0A2G5HG34_CERBT|nr:hypothetical protein CB0940_09088 [Cercospora beticola]PIA91489.1 hypothetical protein CB0940_09088 [Cercospora beticola]